MLIQRSHIRQLHRYLGGLIPRTAIRLVVDVAHVSPDRLTRSGFEGLTAGDTLLPASVGRVSRYNSEGRYLVHRDQPKERRLVGRREWTRHEWAGRDQTREVTEETDIYRDCYPRTFVPPPGVELTVVDREGHRFIVSPPFSWHESPDEDVLHVINLCLELFGEVEIRHENLASFTPPNARRVNWSMLPPGAHPLQTVLAHVQQVVNRRAPSFRGPIMNRLRFMASLNPSEVYLGHGGFAAYVAYVFSSTGKAVLESVLPENATYVFGGNWQAVSRLTKTEVLDGNHHLDRIFHSNGWEQKVEQQAH